LLKAKGKLCFQSKGKPDEKKNDLIEMKMKQV
jgi:hypothetical protein